MRLSIRSGDVTLAADLTGFGPEAVLLHAGGERREVWRPIAENLAATGFSCLALDQRGHGESQGSRDESIDAFDADLRRVMDVRGGCPVIVGASLGGFAAMLALAPEEWQARAAGLVLVDVVPDPDPGRVRAFLEQTRGRLGLPLVAEEILGRAEAFRRIAAQLALPMMLVLAGRSAIAEEDVQRLRGAAPHLLISMVPEAGHLIARDAPERLAEVLGAFFASDAVRDRRIDRFIALAKGEELAHPGGTLRDHLHRVGDTLRRSGAEPAVVDAGRLHAAYGTQGFALPAAALARGDHLLGFVSAEAERLIALYSRCDRRASYPSWGGARPILVDRDNGEVIPLSEQDRGALTALTLANELDVLRHSRAPADALGPVLKPIFVSWRPWLCRVASTELDAWPLGTRVEL